jgi:hypothetical protein
MSWGDGSAPQTHDHSIANQLHLPLAGMQAKLAIAWHMHATFNCKRYPQRHVGLYDLMMGLLRVSMIICTTASASTVLFPLL